MANLYTRSVNSRSSHQMTFYKRKGKALAVEYARGKWRTNRKEPYVDAGGHPVNRGNSGYPAPGAPEMCLIAWLSSYPYRDRGSVIVIKKERYVFSAESEGLIEMAANDNKASDNAGEIEVTFRYLDI